MSQTEKIDILDRAKIMSDIEQILVLLSEQKQGRVFALDGKWGYGKTYILEQLERELEVLQNEETQDDRFYVFHYNCWQYDYYEEPAVAIVSAMLEKRNKEKKIETALTEEYRDLKTVLGKIAGEFVKNKIGIDLVQLCKELEEDKVQEAGNPSDFDKMFSFKKTLDFTRDQIRELSKNKTVLLVVDELDRCMPEYAIKVLERLHHMFEGLDNVIVLLAIDSTQLEHSVKEIYGEQVDTERYLRKFISFRVKLDIGKVQNNFINKFDYYFNKFDDPEDIVRVINEIILLDAIDIRNLEKIVEKLYLIHSICTRDVLGAEVLGFEMIFGIMAYKIQCAKMTGIDTTEIGDFHWIPEIDHDRFINLERVINNSTIQYLKDLKKQMETGISYLDTQNYVKVMSIGIMWYIFDRVFAKKYSLMLPKNVRTGEINFEIDICKLFVDIYKKMI